MMQPVVATLTPAAAIEQRATLMADSGFRERAVKGGAEWQQIASLDGVIGAARDAEAAADEAEAQRQAQAPRAPVQGDATNRTVTPDAAEAFTFEPPASPSDYALPSQEARRQGLEVDFAVEAELRTALHTAGVDKHMASLLYTSAIGAATARRTDVQIEGERITTEQALRAMWKGPAYEANVALAAAEARRIFAAMPASVTNGASYADWIEASGIGSNKVLIQQLYERAKGRTQGAIA